MKYLLLLLLVGCAQNPYVEPELKPYMDKFDQTFDTHSKYSVVFGKDLKLKGKRVLGICTHYGANSAGNLIEIDILDWEWMSEVSREQLMFHEAGHCTLGLKHNEVLLNDLPVSLMYPVLQPDWMYLERQDLYFLEFHEQATLIDLIDRVFRPGDQVF